MVNRLIISPDGFHAPQYIASSPVQKPSLFSADV